MRRILRVIALSWMRGIIMNAQIAPIPAMHMSSCVSHGSPWVPRNASAEAPMVTAVIHSNSSYSALIPKHQKTTMATSQGPGLTIFLRRKTSRAARAGTNP